MALISELVGKLLQPSPGYVFISNLFLRLLGLVYFVAFLSLGVQITALVGADGILPFSELLDYVYLNNGAKSWWLLPNVFWIDSSDITLQAVTIVGGVLSLLQAAGYRPVWLRTALFLAYLSLFHAGQTFLSFQWDSLLLETGFLAIFLTSRPSVLLLFLFHWLLFRLRFMSGVSKLASGDPVWANLTALQYYFETQPLPHWGAWYFHQLPEWILYAGTVFVFFTELIVPFFIFMRRRYRLFAAAITISMQCLIIATSNHNWINLLTILLCLFLLDDDVFRAYLPAHWFTVDVEAGESRLSLSAIILSLSAVLAIPSSVAAFIDRFTPVEVPSSLQRLTATVRPWGIGHIFHLFPSMQTERHELQIEGSDDGQEWRAYGFRYKPGALDAKPEIIIPHQPRLDWLMWFVPAQYGEMMWWFDRFMLKLKQGSPQVLSLMAYNPFPDKPPRYLRVQVFQYHFTDYDERERSGNWWQRRYLGPFPQVPPRRP